MEYSFDHREEYAHADRLASQWCDRAGNPTTRSRKFFQTLNAKSTSSDVRETSESRESTASVKI